MSENLVPTGIYCVGIPAPLLAQGMTELSSSELRVLLYIYLHTLGYKKSEDSLTYNQMTNGIVTRDGKLLDKGAGVSRRSLVGALTGLEEKGYIKRQTGANSASTKIVLCFGAPEFQGAVITNPQLTDNQRKSQIEVNLSGKQRKKQAVQKTHLPSVQLLHPSYKNHIINHGDDRKSEESETLTQKSKELTVAEVNNPELDKAIDYLIANIPNLARTDARTISQMALIKNGRNQTYLEQLVEYILSQPKIHTPAAVLTRLVKNNSERVVAPFRNRRGTQAVKTTYSATTALQGRTEITTSERQFYPFASNYLAKTNAVPSGEVAFETPLGFAVSAHSLTPNSPQDFIAVTPCLPKRRSTTGRKSKNTTGFIQTWFDWDEQGSSYNVCSGSTEKFETEKELPQPSLPPAVPATTLSSVQVYPAPLLTFGSSQPPQPIPVCLETALARLQEDVRGRLKFSVSRELPQLLTGARLVLDLASRAGQSRMVKLKFANETAQRLLSAQDYQIIKLSLRQSLQSSGEQFLLEVAGEHAENGYNLTTGQEHHSCFWEQVS